MSDKRPEPVSEKLIFANCSKIVFIRSLLVLTCWRPAKAAFLHKSVLQNVGHHLNGHTLCIHSTKLSGRSTVWQTAFQQVPSKVNTKLHRPIVPLGNSSMIESSNHTRLKSHLPLLDALFNGTFRSYANFATL